MFNRKKKEEARQERFDALYKGIEDVVKTLEVQTEKALEQEDPAMRLLALRSVEKGIKNLSKKNRKTVEKEKTLLPTGILIVSSAFAFGGGIYCWMLDPLFVLGLPAAATTLGTALHLGTQKEKTGKAFEESLIHLVARLKKASKKIDTAVNVTKKHQMNDVLQSEKYDELISLFPDLTKDFEQVAQNKLEAQLEQKYLSKKKQIPANDTPKEMDKPKSTGVMLQKKKSKN